MATGQGNRTIQKPHPVLVLNLVCNGAGPTVFLTAFKESSTAEHFEELVKLHQVSLERNRCFVVAMSEDTELFLLPIQSKFNQDKNSSELIFWGYTVMRGAVTHVTEMLKTCKIPLVFDLDETLVLANSLSSLTTRKKQLSSKISTLKDNPSSAEKYCYLNFPFRLVDCCRFVALLKEQEIILEDIKQLIMFCETNQITVNGKSIQAQHEYAEHNGQLFLRPVIRSGQKIFTRINPLKQETSMLIRIRDGWEALSKYLRSEGTNDKRQRFKIWVCTAAERDYALEAWRLLDTYSELIPNDEIKTRLICLRNQKKTLFQTFNIGPLHKDSVPSKAMVMSKKNLGPLTEGCSEMPMAIIIDDRLQVWKKRNRDQILHISPFNTRRVDENDNKIFQMTNIFQNTRASFYFEIFENLTPVVNESMKRGFKNEDQIREFHHLIKSGASIVPFLNMNYESKTVVSVVSESVPVQEPIDVSTKPTNSKLVTKLDNSLLPPFHEKKKLSQLIAEMNRKRKEISRLKRSVEFINNSDGDRVDNQEESEDEIDVPPLLLSQKKQTTASVEILDGIDPTTNHKNSVCLEKAEDVSSDGQITNGMDIRLRTASCTLSSGTAEVCKECNHENQVSSDGELLQRTEVIRISQSVQHNMFQKSSFYSQNHQSSDTSNKIALFKIADGMNFAQKNFENEGIEQKQQVMVGRNTHDLVTLHSQVLFDQTDFFVPNEMLQRDFVFPPEQNSRDASSSQKFYPVANTAQNSASSQFPSRGSTSESTWKQQIHSQTSKLLCYPS
eukprot:g7196.t1